MSALRQTATYLQAMRRNGYAAKGRVNVARPRYPMAIERAYAAELVAIVRELRGLADRALAEVTTPQRQDSAASRNAVQKLGQVRNSRVVQVATQASTTAANATSNAQRTDLARTTSARLGVDLTPLLRDPKMAARIEGFVSENVALVKSLGNKSLDELEKLVTRAYADGTRAETLAAQIADRWQISERHARLIARDQIGKLNGQITMMRHQELGLDRYKWLSVADGRVRPTHRTRHGKVFSYSGKDAAPARPGEEIACRCMGEPMLADIEDEFDRLLGSGPVAAISPAPATTRLPAPPRKPRQPRIKAGQTTTAVLTVPPAAVNPVAALPPPLPLPPPPLIGAKQAFGLTFSATPAAQPQLTKAQAQQLDKAFGKVRDGGRNPNPKKQKVIREHLRATVEQYGIASARTDTKALAIDPWLAKIPPALQTDRRIVKLLKKNDASFEIKKSRGFRGAHYANGHIRIDTAVARNAAQAINDAANGVDVRAVIAAGGDEAKRLSTGVNDYRTHIHETLHSYGPRPQLAAQAYTQKGLEVEEVTTEVAARRIVREQFSLGLRDVAALSSPTTTAPMVERGSYDRYIAPFRDSVRSGITETTGKSVTDDAAYKMLEDAALRFKSLPQNDRARTPQGMVELLAESFDFDAIERDVGPVDRRKLADTIADKIDPSRVMIRKNSPAKP